MLGLGDVALSPLMPNSPHGHFDAVGKIVVPGTFERDELGKLAHSLGRQGCGELQPAVLYEGLQAFDAENFAAGIDEGHNEQLELGGLLL